MKTNECIILAGGLGTRLQSVVNDVPKCMAEVAKKPFLSHIFDYLEVSNYKHIVLSLGYKSEVVIDWLQTQNRNFKVSYVIENEALGTGGAIQFAFSKIEGPEAVVLNGDTFFNIDIDKLSNFHHSKKADISLALKRMKDFDRYGSVKVNTDNRIEKFEEKTHTVEGLINGGVYIINKSIFTKIDLPKVYSFEKEILENQSSTVNIFGLPFNDYFIDIGIPADYAKANKDFLNKKLSE